MTNTPTIFPSVEIPLSIPAERPADCQVRSYDPTQIGVNAENVATGIK